MIKEVDENRKIIGLKQLLKDNDMTVRDLSISYHILLALGFGLLTYQAYLEGSTIFIFKQILTTVPVLVIIGQIFYHKKDRWHDDKDQICESCSEELEAEWNYCPFCGKNYLWRRQ